MADKTHFPNLNGLRFICALLVMITHIEETKVAHGGQMVDWIHNYLPPGGISVTMFFVLSGFLISYLLLKEHEQSGKINLKNYYLRRTFRIWPLYYLIIIVGFLVLPHIGMFSSEYALMKSHGYYLNFISMLLFLPGFVFGLPRLCQTMGPTWSVRVEEAFYLFWPFVVRRSNKFVKLCIGILVVFAVAHIGLYTLRHILAGHPFIVNRLERLTVLITFYRFGCMAIGGIAAYLVVTNRKDILSVIFLKDVQIAVYVATIAMLVFKVRIPLMHHEFYSLFFASIILNLAVNPNSLVSLNYKWLNYLGKISYGLYMYHPIMRLVSLSMTEKAFSSVVTGWQMNVMYYALTFALTIVIAALSYHFFEMPFLRRKDKFAIVKTS